MNISWNMPWMLVIAAQPLLMYMLRRYFEHKRLDSYANKALQPWVIIHKKHTLKNSVYLRNISYILAWMLFAVAAAGPRLSEQTPIGSNNYGQDVMVVIDISQSMQASDLSPTRLRQSTSKIKYLINNMPNSRIGIIVYAAKPHLYIPLTYDKKALIFYLTNLELLVPPSQGSKPLAALKLAHDSLSDKNKPNADRQNSIILITDTDTDTQVNDSLKNSTQSFPKTPIYTLLMAEKRGEVIPSFKEGWINNEGQPVISRPQPKSYQYLSEKTNGYLTVSKPDNSGVDAIIESIKSSYNKGLDPNELTTWHEYFYILLLPAILLLFISMMPYKIKRPATRQVSSTLLALLVISTLSKSPELQANQNSIIRNAHTALTNNNYTKSRELYSSVNNFQGRFGEAVSLYRLDDYPRAIRLFEQAMLLANSNLEYSDTLYNLGTSYFQMGNYKLAIASFEGALLYTPRSDKAAKNLTYSKKAMQAVEDRKKILAITKRSGRGPRSARAETNIEIKNNSSVSLDDSEEKNNDEKSNFEASEIDIPEFIILKGIEFAKSSKQNKSYSRNASLVSSAITVDQLSRLHDNQSSLWKRIFELEEGYPAPLDEPEVIPGVRPW